MNQTVDPRNPAPRSPANRPGSRPRLSLAAVAALLMLLPLSTADRAAAHETDQYILPPGRPFADLSDELTHQFYDAIRLGVTDLNRKIRKARESGASDARLEELHAPETVAMAVNRQFPAAYPFIEGLETRLDSEAWKRRHPGRILGYKSQWATASNRYLPIDPRWVFRVWHASTIKAFGVYLGTDKIGHLSDMGKNYYQAYRKAIRQGLSEEEAIDRALHLGTDHFFYSESGVLGYLSAGAYSNADLAANYVGFLFYRNLTEPVRLEGERRPPMVVRDGPYWRLAPHVRRNSGFLAWFFSDHLDEALNPSLFESGMMRSFIRDAIRERGDALLWRYRDANGGRRPPEYFEDKAERLTTYWGNDYGHRGTDKTLITIAEACYGGVEADAEPGERNAFGRTPLHEAVLAGDREAVRRWIDRGAEANAEIRSDATYSSEWGSTPLHLAARDGRTAIARLLLRAGAKVNARNDRGITPLHRAGANPELVALLLEAGASPNAADDRGRTPLHRAAAAEAGADAGKEGSTAAVRTVRLLLGQGARVSATDRAGLTALHRAAEAGRTGIITALLEAGADPNARTEAGLTPLHLAARQPSPEPAVTLVEAGAKVNARDQFGYTPLHEASRAGSASVVAVLLERGAEADAPDAYRTRPLHLAARFGRVEAAANLMIGGAEVGVTNAAGRTPLHEAAAAGSLPLVRRLVASGARPEATDRSGATPGELAERHGHAFINEALRELLAAGP